MINNYWEEQDMDKRVALFHEEQMKKMELPEWILNIKCPFCSGALPKRSVRKIQFCFNTRNFGEIAVEVFCDECRKMDTLYFRTKTNNLCDFVSCLNNKEAPSGEVLIEEEMFKANYNNIMELMFQQQKQQKQQEEKNDVN